MKGTATIPLDDLDMLRKLHDGQNSSRPIKITYMFDLLRTCNIYHFTDDSVRESFNKLADEYNKLRELLLRSDDDEMKLRLEIEKLKLELQKIKKRKWYHFF